MKSTIKDDTQLLTTKELLKHLKLAPITIYKMVEAGQLPSLKIGTARRFRVSDIEKWLKKQTT